MADLAAICEGFYLVGAAGRERGIDPGRPGVPPFGRKLYHASAFRVAKSCSTIPKWKIRAIERKASERISRLTSEHRLSFWTNALDSILEELLTTRFCGIVADYDGTLCSEDRRFEPLPSEMVNSLVHLLESGLVLGIATGRGKSVRERLYEAIPKRYRSQVIVGYYNGSQILPLDSPELPDGTEHVSTELASVANAVQADRLLAQATISLRHRQITLSSVRGLSLDALCEHAEALVNRVAPDGMRVMRSGHSVDVVPESVSKLAVVERLRELAGDGENAPVLRFGDRGRWPGNDAQILASPHGLSVHEVSSDAQSCWNIAPPGQRGWQAMLWCLSHLHLSKHGIRFRLPPSEGA
jgi:hydroxymethylpyrimidine pyrophosphatase-like HAD family hydrolase